MRPDERDFAYLWDMREETRQIAEFLNGVSKDEFIADKRIRYAVERSLMIIGEAANHISDTYKFAHPEIPWLQIIGQRNILAHEYGEIKADRIWSTAAMELPQLLIDLENLLIA